MTKYDVVISVRRGEGMLKKVAKKYGLAYHGWDGNKFVCTGEADLKKIKKLEIICRMKGLRMKLQNQFAMRGTNYRQAFLDRNPPVWRNRYFCAYCGMLIPRASVTVDHLYPVNCAQRSAQMQKRLQRKGWTSINDVRNLVAACECCNKRKASHMGRWIIMGKVGRHNWLWVARHSARLAALIGFGYAIVQFVFL